VANYSFGVGSNHEELFILFVLTLEMIIFSFGVNVERGSWEHRREARAREERINVSD
jgi:hypothetical protein